MTKRDALPYRPCGGVVLLNRDGLIFGAERIDTPGAWQMPQGGLDKGEEPLDGALRELREETGIKRKQVEVIAVTPDWVRYDLPDDLLGKVWKGKWRGQEQKWVLARYLGKDSDIDLQAQDEEFGRWQWMTPQALLEAIVPFKRSVYEEVFAAFAEHLR